MVVFCDLDRAIETLRFRESLALDAESAFVGLFNLDLLVELVEREDFARAGGDEALALLNAHSSIDLALVQLDDWLLVHDAGGDGAPFGVVLADALADCKAHGHSLVLAELHDGDGMEIKAVLVAVLDGADALALVDWLDVCGSDLKRLRVRVVLLKAQLDGATGAAIPARALLDLFEVSNVIGDERNKAAPVRDVLVVQRRDVLLDLDLIDGHGWHLGDDDSTERICDRQISVEQLELDGRLIDVQNVDLH